MGSEEVAGRSALIEKYREGGYPRRTLNFFFFRG